MPSIEFSDDDYEFLKAQAEKEGVSIEEYVGFMVDRQRLIVKYPPGSGSAPKEAPKSTMEPPHRKWGM